MAVPANNPNPSFVRPRAAPSEGKTRAAMTLNRKITEIDWAISSSSAPMTGAVAAMALPPQIDEPTPTRTALLELICNILYIIKAITSDVVMVERMIGRDCFPFARISVRFIPNPRNTTAVCRIFLDVKLIPGEKTVLSVRIRVTIIPIRIEKTGPPTTGTAFPSSHDGMAISRHKSRPAPFFLKKFIKYSSCVLCNKNLQSAITIDSCLQIL